MTRRSDPPRRQPFPSEHGTDPAAVKRIDSLRAAGEALDAALREAQRYTERAASTETSKPLVLVVEDSHELREAYALGLRYAGFHVEEAADGEEGVYRAKLLRPDVIVLDFALPRLDGGEVIRRLAADEATRGIPVLLVSGYTEVIPREVRLGCAGFLAKPCAPHELAGLLHLIVAASAGRPPVSRQPSAHPHPKADR